ncbi:MAG: hypothetical protein KAX64_04125 [Chromatiaceae bacterium]|nr:hypothetical protein [Chromatiaceae bacterium]
MGAVLIELALAYYREPLRYPRLADSRQPLPAGFAALVPAFGVALVPRHLPATAEALGASAEEIIAAARFLVRQVLLAPGASTWRMLGFEAEAPPARVRQHYQLLIRLFHPDRQARMGDLDTDYAARLNHAYQTLRGDSAAVEDEVEADAETEECQPSAITSDELRRFFQPRLSLDSGQASRAKRGQWRRLTRRSLLVAALGLIVGVAVFILVSLMSPSNPHLQMSPNRSAQETATERQPSYLQGTALKTPDVKPALLQPLDAEVLSPSASPVASPPERTSIMGLVGPEGDRLAAMELRQREIAKEMARMVAEREELARHQVEQARQRQEEAQRLDARRQVALAEAERQERQVAEAEARLQAEREALEQQRGKLSRQESSGVSAWEAEQRAALVEAERKLLLAAEAEARLKAEREVLERQKAEQARREQELAKQQEAERQVALAEAGRRQREAAEAETRLKAERQALERLKAEQAQREKTEAKSREAERQAELAEAQRRQRQAAEAEARAQAEQKARERQAAEQAREQARMAAEADRRREAEAKPAPPVADPNNVVARLTHVYGQGDLEGLVSLFTADAQVSGGRGKAFIRGDYAAFFAQHPFRQLQIKGMKWQAGKEGRLVGTGSLVVKTRQNSGEAWGSASGTIRFELLPVAGGYKISGMEHEIN